MQPSIAIRKMHATLSNKKGLLPIMWGHEKALEQEKQTGSVITTKLSTSAVLHMRKHWTLVCANAKHAHPNLATQAMQLCTERAL
eukprot:8619187-Alexandrium_andersonii.AAC.2